MTSICLSLYSLRIFPSYSCCPQHRAKVPCGDLPTVSFSGFIKKPTIYSIISMTLRLYTVPPIYGFIQNKVNTLTILFRLGKNIGPNEPLRFLGTFLFDPHVACLNLFRYGYYECSPPYACRAYCSLNEHQAHPQASSQCHVFCRSFKRLLSSSPILNCLKSSSRSKYCVS